MTDTLQAELDRIRREQRYEQDVAILRPPKVKQETCPEVFWAAAIVFAVPLAPFMSLLF
jgi:hypothetical protein